jgi:hypothetical protein
MVDNRNPMISLFLQCHLKSMKRRKTMPENEIGEVELARIRETMTKIAPEYQRLTALLAIRGECVCSGATALSGVGTGTCRCPTAALS